MPATSPSPTISIILPTWNEATVIASTLAKLAPFRARGAEILVADGGSRDATVSLASRLADRVIQAPKGRAVQMNAGAAVARGTYLLFLHADTELPVEAFDALVECMAKAVAWGRFDVRLSGCHPVLRVVETLMNWRSRLTGIVTGDQGIFVRRDVFEVVGGYPPIALMEDIALSKSLKSRAWPVCLGQRVTTSSRRWETRGIGSTIFLMWELRLRYFLGADPADLAREYYGRD
ncbi:MAG TPA: TIGR04283 family arsenosugar biosynthesis glycosyltransferase [Methylococcus sp.]|nr:TIGR04283 family arsenosugar biosynthesis glycosyltransferase [Methylococcus sp.]